MKNFKKLLAVVVSLTILLTLTVPAFAAAEMTAAEKAELLGVLQGAGNGVDSAYLASATNRAQAATLFLRLLGKEDEAKAYEGTDNFTDVVGNEWFAPMLAYLKANTDLGFNGYPDGSFKPYQIITAQEIYKVFLTVLGFKQDTDFTWGETMEAAAEQGMNDLVNGNANITNNELAVAVVEALQAEMKDGDQTLVNFLIAAGIISAADANAAGLVVSLAIVDAKATNVDEITVSFNQAVPADQTVVVKNGLITPTVKATWNSDRTEVVLKKDSAFTAATYQVTVGDLTANVKVDAAVASQVVISQSTILVTGTDKNLTVKLLNQYGREMSYTGETFYVTAYNKTTGATLLVRAGDKANEFKVDTSAVKENEVVFVQAMNQKSSIVGNAELTAVKPSVVTSFAMTGVVMPTDQDKVFVDDKDVVISYEAYDQYGVAMTITTKAGLTFVSSNATILDTASINFDSKGVMTFDPNGTSGTANLSVLVNSASVVNTLPISVYDLSAIKNVTIAGPVDNVISGEATEVSYAIADQFGTELVKKDNAANIKAKLTFVSSNDGIVKPADFTVNDKGVLTVKPVGAAGSATVFFYWDGKQVGSSTITVNAKAVPVEITNVTINKGMEVKGATITLGLGALSIVDQYGRPYSAVANGMTVADFDWDFTSDASKQYVNLTTNAKDWTFTSSATEGAIDFTVGIIADKAKDPEVIKADSDFSFSMQTYDVTKTENGVTYEFAPVSVLYSNVGFATLTDAGSYAQLVKLIGKTKDGVSITLANNKIANLTSSNPEIVVNKLVDGNGVVTYKVFAKDDAAQTATLRAYDANAKLIDSMDVTSSVEARYVKSVVFNEAKAFGTDATGAVNAAVKDAAKLDGLNVANVLSAAKTTNGLGLYINDQYGVNMLDTTTPGAFNLMAGGFFTSSNANVLSIAANGTMTVTTNGAVTLTYTANNGLQDSITFTVTGK